MQKFYMILFFGILFFSLTKIAACQTRYGNELSDSVLKAVDSKNNILYAGIDNRIITDYSRFEEDHEYILKVNNGIIFSDSIYYISVPDRPGDARFLVLGIRDNDTALIGYRYFEVRNVPEPLLAVDTLRLKEEDVISKNHLLNCDSLNIFISDDIIGSESWFKIVKFTLGYVYGGYYVEHVNNTNKLSRETKQIIYTIGPTKEIIIKPVVKGEGKLIKELPIFRLTLY
jgi:hypothetical protein